MTARACVALLVLAPACFVDNGASTPASSPSSSSASSTSTPDEPTTSSASSTSTDEATTSAPDPTIPCWDRLEDGWPKVGAKLELPDLTAPFITPDGLDLYYLDLATHRPHRSTRTSRTDAFTPGTQLSAWSELGDSVPSYPIVLLGGDLMLLTMNGDVHYALHTPDAGDEFSVPLPVPEVSTADSENNITATADATTLIVQRDDGPPSGPLTSTFRFHQYTRKADDPEAPFTGGQDVTPTIFPIDSIVTVCPVLSPDGLHLFFTANTRVIVDFEEPEDFVIHYTSRTGIDAPWAEPIELDGVASDEGLACASSVTEDGCTLAYYTVDTIGGVGGALAHYLADRDP